MPDMSSEHIIETTGIAVVKTPFKNTKVILDKKINN